MWSTPLGDRTLSGVEATVFRFTLGSMIAELERDADAHQSGVRAFDSLSLGQRWSLLQEVAMALLHETSSPPLRTAFAEAAICAIYKQLSYRIEAEIEAGQEDECDADSDSDDASTLSPLTAARSLVHEACGVLGLTNADSPEDENPIEWHFAVEDLMDRVLWGRDFEQEQCDRSSHESCGQAVTPAGYFSADCVEPSPQEIYSIRNALKVIATAAS